MGYGVIGSPTGSGPVSLGSSPGTPAGLQVPACETCRDFSLLAQRVRRPAGGGGPQRACLWADRVSARRGTAVGRGTGSVAGPGPAPAAAALGARQAQDEQQYDGADDRADD